MKDVFADREDVVALMTNHPKGGELPTFNHALCGLYAAGYGAEEVTDYRLSTAAQATDNGRQTTADNTTAADTVMTAANESDMNNNAQPTAASLDALAQALAQVLQSNGHTAANAPTIATRPLSARSSSAAPAWACPA